MCNRACVFGFDQFEVLQEQELREEMENGLRDRCVDKSPSPSQVSPSRLHCFPYYVLSSCCVYAASCVCLDHANFFSCVGMHVFALFSLFLTIFIVGERMGLGSQETDWCWLWPCLRLSILVGSFPFHCAPREASRCVCLFSFSCAVSCGAAHPQNPVVHAQIRV